MKFPIKLWDKAYKAVLLSVPKTEGLYDDIHKISVHHMEVMSKYNDLLEVCREQEIKLLYLADCLERKSSAINKISTN